MTDFSSGRPSAERLVTDIDAYQDALTGGQKVRVAQLCGRVLRGDRPNDFETLTNDLVACLNISCQTDLSVNWAPMPS